MSEPVIRTLTLTNGLTVDLLRQLLDEMAPADRLVAPKGGVELSWLVAATAGDDEPEPDPVAEALAVPHLAAVAGKLRHLPAAPGRPRIQDAALALRLDVKRPAAERIASTLAGLPWPPTWLPAPAIESGR